MRGLNDGERIAFLFGLVTGICMMALVLQMVLNWVLTGNVRVD